MQVVSCKPVALQLQELNEALNAFSRKSAMFMSSET
jgi:hypothetical protein